MSLLKPLLYIPPLLAAVGMAFWIHARLQPSSQAVGDVPPLGMASEMEPADPVRGAKPIAGEFTSEAPHDPVTLAIEKRDWKAMSFLFDRGKGGELGSEVVLRLRDFIKTLDAADFKEAAEALGPDNEVVSSTGFEVHLIIGWIAKDPAAVLNFYAPRMMKPGFGCNQSLYPAMRAYAKKDLPGAVAWLHDLTRKGGFDTKATDGNNSIWAGYMAELIHGGMTVDLEAVKREMEGCTSSDHRHILDTIGMYGVLPEEQSAYGILCREYGDEYSIINVLQRICVSDIMSRGAGPEEVSATMDRLQANPKERSRGASDAAGFLIQAVGRARDYTAEDLPRLTDWLQKEGVKDLDRRTGVLLGTMASSRPSQLDWVYGTLAAYHDKDSYQSVLNGFLRCSVVWRKRAEAQALLDSMSNEAWKKEILKDTVSELK